MSRRPLVTYSTRYLEDRMSELEADTSALSAAVSILLEDGYSDEQASTLVLGAVRVGRDPVGFAEYLVRLREAAQV